MTALKLASKKDHAIKIEELNISEKKADAIVEALREFAEELGYREERIEDLLCRRCDGFSPYSHNKGGLGCVAFLDQYMAEMNGTGFENCDATLKKYYEYDVESFCDDEGITKEEFEKKMYDERDDDFQEQFDEYRRSGDDTVLFGLDMMLSSETELNLRFTVCAKDSPYHRKFDDLIDIDIEFKNVTELKKKLKKVLKRDEVRTFSSNLSEAW